MADQTPENEVETPQKEIGRKRRLFQKWLHRVTLGVAIIAPLTFIVAAIGYKLDLLSLSFSLRTLTFKVGPLLLALSLVLALITFVLAWVIKPKKGLWVAAIAAMIPLSGGLKIAKIRATGTQLPVIHDVTTDTQNPPVFGAAILAERSAVERVNSIDYVGKKAPFQAADGTRTEKLVSALQTKAYPQIRPLIMTEQMEVVFGRALATAKSMGWRIKEEDVATGRIDATDTTFWYGFDDDVTIRLRASEGGGTIVDVRSVSRVGMSDLGKNAARIEAFLERLAE